MNPEITEKTERLVQLLNGENLGGVLLNSHANFAWATSGKNNGIDTSREPGACFLLIGNDGEKFVLANNIEMPRILAEEISAAEFEPVEFSWEEEKAAPDFIAEKARALLTGNLELAADSFISPAVKNIEGAIARYRYRLTDFEIERLRQLGKDAGAILGNLPNILKPGTSELEIARIVRDKLAKRDIQAVVTLVGADERIARFRHPVPTENIWQKVLLVAVCAKRGGLIVSLSRIFCAGQIPVDLRKRTDSAARVHAKLLAATRIKTSGAELYQIIAEAYAAEGFPGEIHRHHQGGACGYRTRDWVAHPHSAELVQLHQAFAWNPTITGTKMEETCLVTENGIEILTTSPDFPYISTEIDGREYVSPDILCLK